MSDFYNHAGYPAQGAAGSSSAMRAELDAIAAAFNKLPILSGNPLKIVRVNSSGTALEAVTAGSADISASDVSVTPAGSISSLNVQAALVELDTDISSKQEAATAVSKTASTGSAEMPAGTTAERDGTPLEGWTRYNKTIGKLETYNGTAWSSVGGGAGATGAGTDQAFVENDTLITGDYTIGQGGLTDCTISIATPCNVTVANDWVADQMVWLTTTGALPTGLSTSAAYYVLAAGLTTSNVRLSLTAGGAAINTTGTQSGVHKIAKCKNASIAGQFGTASGVTVTIPPGCTLVNT